MTQFDDGTLRAAFQPICPICRNKGYTVEAVDLLEVLRKVSWRGGDQLYHYLIPGDIHVDK